MLSVRWSTTVVFFIWMWMPSYTSLAYAKWRKFTRNHYIVYFAGHQKRCSVTTQRRQRRTSTYRTSDCPNTFRNQCSYSCTLIAWPAATDDQHRAHGSLLWRKSLASSDLCSSAFIDFMNSEEASLPFLMLSSLKEEDDIDVLAQMITTYLAVSTC